MRFIDFHTHIYPQKIADKATQSVCEFYDLHTECNGTAEELYELGKKSGVTDFVLLPVAIKASHVRSINKFIVDVQSSNEAFHGFGSVHADMKDIIGELDFIKESGLKGVKIHPDTQRFNIDDERLYPLYESIEGNMPIVIHCGDPRYDYSHPSRLKKVLSDFPKLHVIAAHLGGWEIFETASEILKDQNCYFDISSCMPFMSAEKMVDYINTYGDEIVLFGTDYPLWTPERETKSFLKLPLSESAKENIAYKNALEILKGNFYY